MNTLREAVGEYLNMRRALGFKLRDAGKALHEFVAFLERRDATYITQDLALAWAKQPSNVQPAHWAQRLSAARIFARYRSIADRRTQVPSVGLLPFRAKRATPYLYSDEEIRNLLGAALKLSDGTGLRPWLYHCLLGLLSISGLRVGEAFDLKVADIDLNAGIVRIRGLSSARVGSYPCTLRRSTSLPTTSPVANDFGRSHGLVVSVRFQSWQPDRWRRGPQDVLQVVA